MKRKIAMLLIAGCLLGMTACGETATEEEPVAEATEAAQEEAVEEATEAPTEAPEETPEETPEATEEPAEESAGEVVEENGLRKEPVYTNKELGVTGETGAFKYSIDAIQVSKLTATTDDMAQMLGIEKDKEIALVVVDASAENTTEDTLYFYLGQATLTSDTKEQVEPDLMLSDYIDGEFIGNVVQSGSMMYLLKNSSAEDITNVSLHIDAPSDEEFNTVGEEVSLDIAIG